MRLSNVLMLYFLLGVILWGGGAIQWDNSGVGQLIVEVDDQGDARVNSSTSGDLNQLGGPIQEAASTVSGGGLIAIWNFLIKFLGFMFWPITTLQGWNSPTEAVVLLGGAPSFALLAATLRAVRSEA